MALRKDPRAQCSNCSSYLDSVQRECCFNSCFPFPDKIVTKEHTKCVCPALFTFSFKTASLNPFDTKNCPHVRSNLSLPEVLEFKMSGEERFVISRIWIPVRSVFGPLIAPSQPRSSSSTARYSFQSDASSWSDYLLDSEDKCNWMKFVREAQSVTEQNLTAFQFRGHIFFAAIKEINPGDELRVWYANNYAADLGQSFFPRFGPNSGLSLEGFQKRETSKSPSDIQDSDLNSDEDAVIDNEMGILNGEPESLFVGDSGSNSDVELWNTVAMPSNCCHHSGPHVESLIGDQELQRKSRDNLMENFAAVSTAGKVVAISRFKCTETQENVAEVAVQEKCVEKRTYRSELSHVVDSTSQSDKYSGGVCNKAFEPEDVMQLCETNGNYDCPLCERRYSTWLKVRLHIAVTHGSRKHTCELCGITAKNKSELKRHSKTHSSDTPSTSEWKCDTCGNVFKTVKQMKDHMCCSHPSTTVKSPQNNTGGRHTGNSAKLSVDTSKKVTRQSPRKQVHPPKVEIPSVGSSIAVVKTLQQDPAKTTITRSGNVCDRLTRNSAKLLVNTGILRQNPASTPITGSRQIRSQKREVVQKSEVGKSSLKRNRLKRKPVSSEMKKVDSWRITRATKALIGILDEAVTQLKSPPRKRR